MRKYFKKAAYQQNLKIFLMWIHGEIKISPDFAARLKKHFNVQTETKGSTTIFAVNQK